MLDLAAAGAPIQEILRRSRQKSLERLTNSGSRQVALFGAAALAIFNAGQSVMPQNVPARAPQAVAATPAARLSGTARLPARPVLPAGLLPRPAPELRL